MFGKIIAVLLATVIILASCEKIKEGNIVKKWYEPARTYIMMMPITISSGKFTTTSFVPMIIHDNEDYCISVKGVLDNEPVEQTFYINKKRYDTVQKGDYICIDGNCYEEDNNNTKKSKK